MSKTAISKTLIGITDSDWDAPDIGKLCNEMRPLFFSTPRPKWRHRLALIFPLALLSGCGGGSGFLAPTPTPAPQAIKIACVGDSITYGEGLADRTVNAYPVLLGMKLGSTYEVRNYGVSGASVLNSGVKPYQSFAAFTQALQFKPDVLIVELGTNDSKSEFDAQRVANFKTDYLTLISAFKSVNPSVKVYTCLPIPSYPLTRRSNILLSRNVLPSIKEVAQQTEAVVIDLNTPFTGSDELYNRLYLNPYHPDSEGASLIAATVYTSLQTTNTTH